MEQWIKLIILIFKSCLIAAMVMVISNHVPLEIWEASIIAFGIAFLA
jgi:hypothetical protein